MRSFFRRMLASAGIIALLVFLLVPLQTRAEDTTGSFWVEYIDVGQGDCALIQCDGHYMLIDGGPASASDVVYTVLKQKGIDNIDVMIATHPHEDHIGGLSGALNYAKVDVCYCSVTSNDTKTFQNLLKYLGKQNKNIIVPSAGDEFKLGSAAVQILGPITSSEDDSNNNSIVTKVTYGDNSFLFMGDAENEEEYSLLRAGADLSCDVLKVGHHGSLSSTTRALLSKTDPEYAVISVGKGNSYGHPTDQTLKRLKYKKIDVYRTDLQGDITFTSDGKNITVTTEKQTTADKIWIPGTAADGQDTPAAVEPDTQTEVPDTQPAAVSYVLNTNTLKFHYPDCPSVSDMSARNRQDVTMTRDEIIALGYVPCHNCNP